MTYCCVYGCPSKKNESPDISFFALPSDCERRNRWLQLFERHDLLKKADDLKPRSYQVCSQHFEESMMSERHVKKLLPHAEPTKCLPTNIDPQSSGSQNENAFFGKHTFDESTQTFVGKDLVSVPIEKLQTLEYVSENQVDSKYFNNKQNLLAPEEILLEYPSDMYTNDDIASKNVSEVLLVCNNDVTAQGNLLRDALLREPICPFKAIPGPGNSDMNDSPNVCRVCLSDNRSMTLLADTQLFQAVTGIWEKHVLLCWECKASLHKIKVFKMKAQKATEILRYHKLISEMPYLSTLVQTHLNLNLVKFEERENNETPEDISNSLHTEEMVKDELDALYEDEIDIVYVNESVKEKDKESEIDLVIVNDSVKDKESKAAKRPPKKYKRKPKPQHDERLQSDIDFVLEEFEKPNFVSMEGTLYDRTYETKEKYMMRKEGFLNKPKSIKNPYCCANCFKNFKQLKSYEKHMETFHVKSGVHCPICSVSCSDESLAKDHMDYFHMLFKCRRCWFAFRSRQRIEDHVVVHDQEKLLQYTCDICGWKTSRQSYLKVHKRQHSKERFECDLCGKHYPMRRSLVYHIRRHNRRELCELCGRTFSDKSHLKVHMYAHSGPEMREHQCDMCDRRFLNRYMLMVHIRTHTGEKPYECANCGKKFTAKAQLVLHCKISHIPGHKRVKITPRFNKTKSTYRNTRVKHDTPDEGERNVKRRRRRNKEKQTHFECDVCHKVFTTKFRLQFHLSSHSDARPFKCEECDRSFKYKAGLWQHRLSHKEKSQQCNICGWKFYLKGNLTSHMLTHTDIKRFECDICGSKFRLNRNMRNHMKIHAKELNTLHEK